VDTATITATSQVSPTLFVTVTDTTSVQLGAFSMFLPLFARNEGLHVKLGVGFGSLVTGTEMMAYDLPLVKEMGATWVRIDLPWAEIETSPGEYHWEQPDALIARLTELGLEPLPLVHIPPPWAAEPACGPISDTLAFESFLDVALERYGPYVNAWEFTNEPDGREPHQYGPGIGCWGLQPEAYARQLEIFHRKVKSLDPGALVVFGGLAYDHWFHFERSFFDKTLEHGAGAFFDVANLHYYPVNPAEFPTMAHKVNEIRDTMTRHNVRGKKIWITETGMWVNYPYGSLEAQRNFIVRELARGFAAGADNILWFAVREEPWEQLLHRWLINRQHRPDNGYYTFQHLAHMLEGASYIRRHHDVPGDVEAYQFAAPGRSIYILWSNSSPRTVAVAATVDATLSNRDGTVSSVIPVQNGQVSFVIGAEPMFLKLE
jgi:hypothetical protein